MGCTSSLFEGGIGLSKDVLTCACRCAESGPTGEPMPALHQPQQRAVEIAKGLARSGRGSFDVAPGAGDEWRFLLDIR